MMEFSADWLALREPADAAARSVRLTDEVGGRLTGGPIRIVDLATGTGTNLRYLQTRLPRPQMWTLIDNDPALLAMLASRLGELSVEQVEVSVRFADLHRMSDDVFTGADLVTASALLDLVSREWLDRLARYCGRAGAAVLFALTHDGRMELSPPDHDDTAVSELVRRHQETDKGFGAAAGRHAIAAAATAFAANGYQVERARSDWRLGPEDDRLQGELVAGWLAAASAMAPGQRAWLEGWARRRADHIAGRRSAMTVGHEDLAAWPRGSNDA